MFDLKKISDDFSFFETRWSRRGQPQLMGQVAELKELLLRRKDLIRANEDLLAQRNKASQEIAKKKRANEDIQKDLDEQKGLGEQIKIKEGEMAAFQEKFDSILFSLPNLPQDDVPLGKDASENKEVRSWGIPKAKSFAVLPHEVLGEKRTWFQFDDAARLTGARFSVVRGAAAKLERALIQFMLDIHTNEHGYEEINPPFIVNDKSLFGTGNLPKFKEDLFKLEGFPYFLIPTAEVPLTNLVGSKELKIGDLPIYMTAYTPCFRSEAGSYGKDLKGLIRQHQFNKVELVKICEPQNSHEEHEKMRANAERILELLGLPYRTVVLSTGDMGFASSKTYDLEVWLPSQNTYREISSISNCYDFQARRMNARFRDAQGKLQYVHTLNGSGLAVGRTLIAILENYQREDGQVEIPEVLIPYMRGAKVI